MNLRFGPFAKLLAVCQLSVQIKDRPSSVRGFAVNNKVIGHYLGWPGLQLKDTPLCCFVHISCVVIRMTERKQSEIAHISTDRLQNGKLTVKV